MRLTRINGSAYKGLGFFSVFLIGGGRAAPAESTSSYPSGLITDPLAFVSQAFDYMIVGGGTAGLTVAARLSEIPFVRVGVIEAGPLHVRDPLIDTPALAGQALGNPLYDWTFASVPQPNANNRVIAQNRGKMLGGSSNLNFMIWQRGSSLEYDSWQELGAGPGWDWEGLFPYFKKSENVHPGPLGVFPGVDTWPGSDDRVEGRNGPVVVSYNNFITPMEGPYKVAAGENGIEFNEDPDAGDATGLFNVARSVDPSTGNRTSSANSYFFPNDQRTNLVVLIGAQASRVVFASSTGVSNVKLHATGVEFIVNGTTFTAKAKKEVILSAGAFQTPHLLELSGIGNKTILESFGIKSLLDIPEVGENLQDHISVSSEFLLKDPTLPIIDQLFQNATFTAQQNELYLTNHTGAFTATGLGIAFTPLQAVIDPSDLEQLLGTFEKELDGRHLSGSERLQADLQLSRIREGKIGQFEFIFRDRSKPGNAAVPGQNHWTIIVSTPTYGRGSVHINSSDPLTAPTINPNYLTFDFDLQVLVRGMQFARKIGATEPLVSLIDFPSSPNSSVSTAADFEGFIKQNVATVWHPVGTAALGPKGQGGVVDEKLIVYGTDNLRVVDASIIPLHVATHIQQTVYAIAEKAADIIKASIRQVGNAG